MAAAMTPQEQTPTALLKMVLKNGRGQVLTWPEEPAEIMDFVQRQLGRESVVAVD